MIDLKRLRQAMVLAETGSFSRAAEALNMSQPSLSQSIRELERRLGAAVFDRAARTVTPTAFGLALLKEGADLVARAEALERDLRRRQGLETGRLAVGFGVYGYRPTIPAVAAAVAGGRGIPDPRRTDRRRDQPLRMAAWWAMWSAMKVWMNQ